VAEESWQRDLYARETREVLQLEKHDAALEDAFQAFEELEKVVNGLADSITGEQIEEIDKEFEFIHKELWRAWENDEIEDQEFQKQISNLYTKYTEKEEA